MRLMKMHGEWVGRLDPDDPEEHQVMEVLGTRYVPLPYTPRATEEYIRNNWRGELSLE